MTHVPSPCRVRDLPGRSLIALPQEIDLSNCPALCAAITSFAGARATRLGVLILDFTRTGFMDSQGARLVQDVRGRLPARVEVRVVAAPLGVPSRVLELTGVRRDVPVYDSLAEALEPERDVRS
ncbi:STAS domain-containing protein [Streptomyces sp. Ru72]|uniref:STAS domain-containing protein n=1 Tax=Streptomyces sp. Ru72 TaxID=2080747 RepID=UPI000CDE41C1|nr:STAS domain-containing protein [Streptomyces sp. Ru72]POX40006.1 anti-anti-sigma factor [Streptomyces sp. Ru72]